ncbi:hypothetical protein [Streptomyces sp. AMCC400023]|uniref:hypothetical protein n=1 Tax=Streptomyces sp. AMCC400023 TaxID=2056258 RepID=UPI001F28603E|nr:hypothetical protein [Streptomyces sp. AMCC400023]UJV42025.1 hypothetical protein CVT30_21225 [Streptomyces sp. AMCC400023]
MRIVSAAKHAAVLARLARTAKELEDTKKANAEQATTITRLRNELDQQRDRKPDGPVQQPKPAVGDAELQRRLNLALRALSEMQDQIDQLQTSHIADTRELHDLRQGVAS